MNVKPEQTAERRKEIENLIIARDYTALNQRLGEAMASHELNSSELKRIALHVMPEDDVPSLAFLVMHGLSLEKDKHTLGNLLNKAVIKGAVNTTKFLKNSDGYSVIKGRMNSERPIHGAFAKTHNEIAKVIITWALEEDKASGNYEGRDQIVMAAASTGRHAHLEQLEKKTQKHIAEGSSFAFYTSVQNNKLDTAKYFAELAPYSVYHQDKRGQNALTAFVPRTPKSADTILNYLTQDVGLDINRIASGGNSFLWKNPSQVDDYGTVAPITKHGKRYLPIYAKYGLDIGKQFENNELLKKTRENRARYNDDRFCSDYQTLADIIYHAPEVSLENLTPADQAFGGYMKHYMAKSPDRSRVNLLLENKHEFMQDPAIATFILYSALAINEPEVLEDLHEQNLERFESKLRSFDQYQSRTYEDCDKENAPYYTATDRIAEHLRDITKQMTQNIIFPVAIKEYDIDVENKDKQYILQNKMAEVVFGTLHQSTKDYKRQGADKMLLLMDRYDRGVNHINAALGKYTPALTWPIYCEPVQAPNGKWIEFIDTSDKLKAAADQLSNCSYGFKEKAATGEYLIFNVSDEKGTFQNMPALRLTDKGGNLEKSSAPLGYKNQSPDEATSQAWEWFVEAAKKNKVSANHKAFCEWSEKETSKKRAKFSAGFNLDRPDWQDAHQSVFSAWQTVLGGTDRYRWRHVKDVEEFVNVTGMRAVLDDLAPKQAFTQNKNLTNATSAYGMHGGRAVPRNG